LIEDFDEAKERHEKELSELRTKAKEAVQLNSELQERNETLVREIEVLKVKADKVCKAFYPA
jgi:hypothetical protein